MPGDNPPHDRRSHPRTRGLGLVELMIALAITATLLTATMVAINASFRAYASAAEQSSTQSSLRMVMHRLIKLIRTSTLHDPLMPNGAVDPPVTLSGSTLTSNHIEMLDAAGNLVRVEYRSADRQLWYLFTPAGGGATQAQPLLGGVTSAQFLLTRRRNDQGLWILDRAVVDLTVEPDRDATLDIERGPNQTLRLVASTNPRKLD